MPNHSAHCVAYYWGEAAKVLGDLEVARTYYETSYDPRYNAWVDVEMALERALENERYAQS